ncbi:MAG: hypothetical protein PHD43_03765 [Methylococcales bacterium]|nr:hypothetical protein [Methylococcales bacterium]
MLLETFAEKTGSLARVIERLTGFMPVKPRQGKLGPSGKQCVPIKDVWLYPLGKAFKYRLVR